MSEQKLAIGKFLNGNGIVPVQGPLREDLDEDNIPGLENIAYAIENYPTIKGVLLGIKTLASIGGSSSDDERKYNNLLTEFLGIRFVSGILGEQVVDLEAASPHRTHNRKTCDIVTLVKNRKNFYEVKDFSSEILTQVPVCEGVTSFTPGLPYKIKPWIEGYVRNCVEKGANYLICKVPAWHVRTHPKLCEDWVKQVYNNYQVLEPNRFKVDHGLAVPSSFNGVYVVRRDENLLLEF